MGAIFIQYTISLLPWEIPYEIIAIENQWKQVDILISKNQALYLNIMIMYIKLHKIIIDKKLTKSTKIWSLWNKQTYPTVTLLLTTQ